MNRNSRLPKGRLRPRLTLSTTLLVGLIAQAYAQTAPAPAAAASQPAQDNKLDTVVVTGIRASLQSSVYAKRESVGFIDAIRPPVRSVVRCRGQVPGRRGR